MLTYSWRQRLKRATSETVKSGSRRNESGRPAAARGARARLLLEQLENRALPSTSFPLNTSSWTGLGPAPITNGQIPGGLSVSGRITAIAAHATDANTIYIATAGGGVWRTTNGGAS